MCLKHGMTELSCFAFAVTAGQLLANRQFELAYAFASLAKHSIQRQPRSAFRGAAMTVWGAFGAWRLMSFNDYINYMHRAFRICIDCVDMTYAGYALGLLSAAMFIGSSSLEVCVRDLQHTIALASISGRNTVSNSTFVFVQVIKILRFCFNMK